MLYVLMPVAIVTFPSQPVFSQVATLANTPIGIILSWNSRMRSWYLSIDNAAGERILTAQRLSPKASPTAGLAIEGLPAGQFTVQGKDGYGQGALGTQLTLWFWTNAEITALIPAEIDYPLTVEIV